MASLRRDPGSNGRIMAEDVNVVSKGQVPENHIFYLAAESARQAGERDMNYGNNVLRSEYQKRLQEVGTLRTRAQLAAQTLRTERGVLLRLRVDLAAVLHEFEGTVDVNLQWLKVHEGFQSTSLTLAETNRSVAEALDGSVRDIRAALLSIVKVMEDVNRLLTEIDQALGDLDQDILAKSGTMMLDRACMENLVALPNPSSISSSQECTPPPVLLSSSTPQPPRSPRNDNSGRGDRFSRGATPRSNLLRSGASGPSGMIQSQNLDGNSLRSGLSNGYAYANRQHDWHSRAQHVIVHGTHVAQKCLPLRRAATALILSIRDSGRLKRNTAVIDALQQQAKHGEHLGRQIELNAKALQGHTIHIGKQRAAMEASLEKLEEQLQNIRQKIRMGAVRPMVDQTPSNVEETLFVEETRLERTKRELQGKLRELTSSEKTTSKLIQDLALQTRSNDLTLAVTKKCLDVKLPAIGSARGPIFTK